MTDLPNIFDVYERKARAYPALILVSPTIVACIATFPVASNQGYLGNSITAAVVVAGFYVLIQAARHAGRRVEKRLWDDWDGPPSTRLVLWSDKTLGDDWKVTAHDAVEAALSIKLLSRNEEEKDGNRARKLIADAFMQVRTILDLESPKGKCEIHNAEYGFARNLLGGCPIGMGVAGVSAIWCLVYWWVKKTASPGWGAFVCLLLLIGFGLAKRFWLPSLAKLTADRYAEKAWATFIELKRFTKTVGKEATG